MQATCTESTVPFRPVRVGVLAGDRSGGHNEDVVSPSSLAVPALRRLGARLRQRRGDVARRHVHLVLCIGSVDDWAARSEEDWEIWAEGVGVVAAEEGVSTVSVFPVSGVGSVPPRIPPRQWATHGVTVRASCEPDGRHRLAEVVNAWPPGQVLTEETLGRVLTGPGGDPDVVVVVGAPGRLPSALVWELAYAELVDLDRSWTDFAGEDLRPAMSDFRTRHRRFGGLGDEPSDDSGSGG